MFWNDHKILLDEILQLKESLSKIETRLSNCELRLTFQLNLSDLKNGIEAALSGNTKKKTKKKVAAQDSES